VSLVTIHYVFGVIGCNERNTEKRHECINMGKVKRLELWGQLFVTWLTFRDLGNFMSLDFCWREWTDSLGHETNNKLSLRNNPLLVLCKTSLWYVASVVCSFYWSVLCARIMFLIFSSHQEVFISFQHLLLRVWLIDLQISEAKFYPYF